MCDVIQRLPKSLIDDQIDIKNNLGYTALMLTCINSNTFTNNKIVKLLLYANVNLQDNEGWSAFGNGMLLFWYRFNRNNLLNIY